MNVVIGVLGNTTSMSNTVFPTGLDNYTNPTASDQLDNATTALKHHVQHSANNEAIAALETKVGIDDSGDVTSLDYKSKNGSFIRTGVQVTSSNLSPEGTDSALTLAVGKGCMAIKITTDYPAWVRIYSTVAAQTADSTRVITTDPLAGSGVLLEVYTVAGTLTINLSPAAHCYNLEASPDANLPVTITNKDTTPRAITVTLVVIPMEG
jgi:hypothetical protein